MLSLVIAGQPPLRALLARDEQEAMARRIIQRPTPPVLAHRCVVAGAARAPFDDRALGAIFEIDRGNLRATDDLAFKSLDYAAAGHGAVSVQHVVAAYKDLQRACLRRARLLPTDLQRALP